MGVFAPQLRHDTRPLASAEPSTAERRTSALWTSALAWQVTIFMGLQSLAFFVLIAWLASIERAAGISRTSAGFHLLLLNLFSLFGTLLCSRLIHRLPDQRPIAIGGSALLAAALAGLLVAPSLAVLWASLAGLSCGVTLVLALSLFGLRTRHHVQAGALSGMAQSVGYAIAAIGPILIGAVHQATSSWTPALTILIVLAAVQAGIGTLASRPKTIADR